ncbi:MAG: hypothetical protein PVJ64_03840, partial [Gemmatimonadales bacterium]
PGWEPTPPDEWVAKVRQVVQGQQWIIDGYYGGTLDVRLKACDAVVFLDLSRLVCLWRVVKRWARHVGRNRPDVAPGCPERLSWEFLKWIWTYSRRQRADILRRLAALEDAKRVIVLDSRRAVRVFFAQFGTAA